MAEIECQLHYDTGTKEVVKTYRVLNTGPNDKITFTTTDPQFLIKIPTKGEGLAKQLELEKFVPKQDGAQQPKEATAWQPQASGAQQPIEGAAQPGKDAETLTADGALYQVKPASSFEPRKIAPEDLPEWLKLKCGTWDDTEKKFISWGGVGPLGYNNGKGGGH